jgi:hypothetical protein
MSAARERVEPPVSAELEAAEERVEQLEVLLPALERIAERTHDLAERTSLPPRPATQERQ